jgi:dynein heavy chain, axonemal
MQELNIEKQLEKIDNTWSGLYLSFSQYQDTDVCQMVADDAITEALETDNLTLQNMSSGKYVQVISIMLLAALLCTIPWH